MLDKLYKESMEEISPDELLIQRTKKLMKEEVKKKPKNFYKYASIAACLIVTFGLFRIIYNSSNDIKFENNSTSYDAIGEFNDFVAEEPNHKQIPNTNYFITAGSSSESLNSTDSIFLSSIFNFFELIVNWFKNLFN